MCLTSSNVDVVGHLRSLLNRSLSLLKCLELEKRNIRSVFYSLMVYTDQSVLRGDSMFGKAR